MAYNKDQNEPKVPISNVEKRQTSELLPRFYRTKGNKKFLQATLDQLTQPGTVKKLNGYIGRETAKAVKSSDIFLEAADKVRQDYQFEPAALVQDYLGNTTFFKDYIDHINHVDVFDGITDHHSRVNKQEFYSWNPHVCWDKFVNYQQYYWLPFGPSPINVLGQQLEVQSTYTVKGVDEVDNVAYLFTPNGLTRNPTLKLFRGQTYVFDIDAQGHPFSIKTQRVSGSLERYTQGIDKFAVEKGKITFTVPLNAPDVLFYVSENAVDTGGVLHILDIEENTAINLETDFLGKKEYIIPNGTASGLKISNGMKLSFGGNVTPEQYGEGFWYVEGVGTAIKLVNERDLEVKTSFNLETQVLFDDTPFDQLPFGDASTLPGTKDYITINRSSTDLNAWSRYNRWFHKDVIEVSASVNGRIADLDQTARATRPIIEFDADIKLYNYGIRAKKNVDVIDRFTTDVFSTIEGSLGYNIDGIDLADGMRVLFTADTDSRVRNKIFKVNFLNVLPPSRQIPFDGIGAVDIDLDRIVFATEHGLNSKNQVTYLAEGNTAVSGLVNRQVYYVKTIDTFTIELYTNPQLTAKVDIFATSTGTHKFEVFPGYRRQITLIEEDDATPVEFETVTVNYGTTETVTSTITGNQGQTYWFNGTTWKLAQVKNSVNQPPLFDVFDENGYSYSDTSVYDGSTFAGTKIFSYKVGSGTIDKELGFPLSYQNINNIGDIVFEFNLLTDKFAYKNLTDVLYKNTDVGFLKIAKDIENYVFENAWTTSLIEDVQPAVRVFRDSGNFPTDAVVGTTFKSANGVIYEYTGTEWIADTFPIDLFDNKDQLDDLEVRVYVNNDRLFRNDSETFSNNEFSVIDGVVRKHVKLGKSVTSSDIVIFKCFTKQPKNNIGHYELPISLQNNPLNNNVEQFTLGEVIDHVDSIVDNINSFAGEYPGNGNLRDIGNLSAYGTQFVQHSGPMNLSLYHLGSKNANIIKALDQARNDYGKFKRAFIVAATESGIDTDPRRHVDYVLQIVNKDYPKTSPYYLSDMFGYTASNRIEYTVIDPRIKTYPLSKPFNLNGCSNRSVNIYLNGEQLLHGKDYVFGTDVFFEVLRDIAEDDLLEAYEFETTDGCFCPPTPTKLGLYPLFEPKIFRDDTYLEPIDVIQGHDGSITVAFGDYRDDLILELEKRIYNNIKVQYDPTVFDVWDFIPGYNRTVDYSKEEFDKILSKYFFQWTVNIQQDYTKDLWYDQTNSFTYNYRGNYTSDSVEVPAHWRGIYKWLFDTDRPHTNPWECLGFSLEPSWWQDIYGPAPYTSDNFILWDDIKEGIIREPGVPVRRNPKFAKPILAEGKPVDENGKLLSPLDTGLIQGKIRIGEGGYFIFGDQAPVESAWRRSSYYPFALIQSCLLMQPNSVLGRCIDRSRITRNRNNQLIYKSTGLRVRLEDLVIPSTANRNSETRNYACGLINYIVDYLSSENTTRLDSYENDLKTLTNKMSTRLGSFTNKPKYKILLDSKTPSTSGGVFVPEEDYFVDLNVSSAIKKVVYSGVVITKFPDGFELRGYNFDNPYFIYYPYLQDNRVINVGGISESFVNWNAGQIYIAGKLVRYNNQYYRVKTNHTSGEKFDTNYYARMPELPVTGGRDAILRKVWDNEDPKVLAYGTKLTTIQEVVDFLQGYGAYLEDQGFVFDDFNNELGLITNWETAVKEFMFWTTQKWDAGAVISLSPAANKLIFRSNSSVVGDIADQFYGYNIYRVDGQKLDIDSITAYRSEGEFILEPENTNYGIFGATLFLIQKEHIVVLENKTLFNDIIYDREAGYRQERVKIIGYVTSNWTGGFEIPGFIYDRATITPWTPWTDYRLGDIVKHKEFFYSASKFLVGVEEFKSEDWVLLDQKPESELLPNWDYKAETFTDFYDLDSDNLDAGQQRIAQHLIGYQKRQYLENIIQNDVSQYKFYQGMIIEKGTQNVLNKLFDVLSADGQESLTFDEEWAFRVGEYGSVDTFNEVEFILDESQFKINPQPLELVNTIDPSVVDFVYRQKPTDVYIKPKDYTSNLWPTVEDSIDYLRTAGYVRKEDVAVNVDTLDDLINFDISNFREGDYVWTAFEDNASRWGVYRFTESLWTIENVTYSNQVVTVICNRVVDLSVGDIVGIENSEKLKGFHKVTGVTLNQFTFSKKLEGFTAFTDKDTILSYVFDTQRIDNIDNANSIVPRYIKPGELIWADDSGNGTWATYKNSGVYRRSNIINSDPAENLNFGLATTVDASGNVCAVSDVQGVTVYEKGSSDNSWSSTNRITVDLVDILSPTSSFGSVIKLAHDASWLAISDVASLSNRGQVCLLDRRVNGEYSYFTTLESQAPALGELFGSNLAFGKLSNGNILAVSALGTNSNQGNVYIYRYIVDAGWSSVLDLASITPGLSASNLFGYDIAMTDDGATLVVSAPEADSRSGKVFVYTFNGTTYTLAKTLTANLIDDAEYFGSSVAISNTGRYIAVGATLANVNNKKDVGEILVYKLDDASYQSGNPYQVITSPRFEVNERYGANVDFMNGDKTLVVFSKNGDIEKISSFDDNTTVFDNNTLKIIDRVFDAGRIDIYDRYNTKFIYGESLENTSLPLSGYGEDISVGNNVILVSAIREADATLEESGTVYSYVKPAGTHSWSVLHSQLPTIDINKIKKVFLYNKDTSELVTYLDVIDPIQGKIPGVADQEIRYKSYFDPAIYSVGNSNVSVDEGANWTTNQVGMLWWDLSKAKFFDPRSGDVIYRTSIWNRLYDSSSIDVYEWVESTILPSAWDKQADTEAGLAKGISGQTRYGDSVYSIRKRYDSVSRTFKETYYFWVKNKKTTSSAVGRTLSAYDVASLISDPISYGYPCIAFTGINSLSLINLAKYLEDKRVVLNIQYWLSDYKNSNYHSQWKLLSTNETTTIPEALERKWFHSLVGKDDNDRVVPDVNLPLKHKYGIEFRPRQSMFVNRVEALKQFVERVNTILKDRLIADDYDLSALNSFEPKPSNVSAEWDIEKDTEAELRFISTTLLTAAQLTPVIVNGRIKQVIIDNPGYGYGKLRSYDTNLWYGPTATVIGSGKDAKLTTIINAQGQVVDVLITNSGVGYDNESAIRVRPFRALVTSDSEALGGWSIYQWDLELTEWSRVRSQSYDVRKYWQYLDWYEVGYNEFVKIDYLVENTYELVTTDIPVGSIAKVKNIGSGGWLLLEKFADNQTIDYTENFKVIGRENGTIKFSSKLYKFEASTLGYDGPLFDSDIYDNSPTTELKIILNAIKDDILIDEFRVDYLKLFFASIRYVLAEQIFVDWVFKTSFVKSMHNVGELKQKVTYNSDNLEFFEQYIKEVKPYRTKVREYVSNYSSLDLSQSSVTDFDLLPVINEKLQVKPLTVTVENGEISSLFDQLTTYPWKHWYDHVGFEITSIVVVDGGEGYLTRPVVEISGVQIPSDATQPAEAKAYITNGRVNRIDLISSGTRWISAPTVTIRGGLSTTGRNARAVAIIGNGVVRTNYVKVKFDRTSKVFEITELSETETFVGTGSRTQFPLKWSPDVTYGNSTVLIDNNTILKDNYTLTTVTSTVRGYTSYSGLITFDTAPAAGAVISVTYKKNFYHLNAPDRINFYYDPKTGQLGKDLAQLMTGVDYGGVQITGVDFRVSVGWDALPWFTEPWDSVDPNFEDYIVLLDDVTYSFRMPYVPEVGQEINIYVSRHSVGGYMPSIRIDDPDYLTINQTNSDAVMTTFVGDGEVDIIVIPETPILTNEIIRVSRNDDNVATVVTKTAHRLYNGEIVTILASDNSFNEVDVAVTILNANSFTYTNTGVEVAPTSATGSVTVNLKSVDRVIFRKDTSDGSYDSQIVEFDTILTGGNLAYSTATGLAAEDIILDGDDLISPTNSHAPEEVVPGHVMDTLAIKVFTRPTGGCPNMMFKNYKGDGVTTDFVIGQYFPNNNSIIVKVDDQIKSVASDFSIDYQNNTVIFGTAPDVGSRISILSVSFNSADLLDLDYFVADGITNEYITKANWLPTISATVLVNGVAVEYVLFSTDENYTDLIGQTWRSRVGIRFEEPPPAGAIINYIIDALGVEQTASIVKSENIIYETGTATYTLANAVGVNPPLDQNVLVKTNQTILKPASANYFTLENNQLDFALNDYKYLGVGVNATDIKVYVGNTPLTLSTDYGVDFDYDSAYYGIVNDSITFVGGSNYTVGDLLTPVGGVVGSDGFEAKFEVSAVANPTIGYTAISSAAVVTTTTSAASIATGTWVKLNSTFGLSGILPGRKYYVFNATALGFTLAETQANALAGIPVTGVTGSFAGTSTAIYDGPGLIQGLEMINAGSYIEPPSSPMTVTGGTGTGAEISADFEIVSNEPNIKVTINPLKYVEGEKLTIIVTKTADYYIENGEITFANTYPDGTVFEVISFYNHNVLGIERTVDELIPTTAINSGTAEYFTLSGKLGGSFKLRNTAVSGNFVWVIKNGQLLMHGVDYFLQPDFVTVKLKDYLFDEDVVQVIAFTNVVVSDSFAYMQFKDILNRVHYKRLNKDKSTRLDKDLTHFDRTIVVKDASVLDNPNPARNLPGIIEINGERIEYFVKTGNVLSQLRRSTLGTGAPYLHSKDSLVINLGPSETIPYKDESVVTTHTSDGVSNVIPLPYIPKTLIINNKVVTVDVEVFVGGVRLKKTEYKVYSKTNNPDAIRPQDQTGHLIYPDSPEGDVTYPAEFGTTGKAELRLTVIPTIGTRIVVVRKQGKLWNTPGQRLASSDNVIANFLKSASTVWVESYLDKYENRVLGADGNPLQTGDGDPLEY